MPALPAGPDDAAAAADRGENRDPGRTTQICLTLKLRLENRLPFASEVVVSDSLICIRPVDRLAGRGLDGSTHAPLISLAARLRSNHSRHQILGAAFNPFHATPQSRTGSRGAA
jgi:hypothetical protein